MSDQGGKDGEKDWPPLILAVAPNGARKTAVDHPALPITPEEIAKTGAACREAGAAMIHLHVRDREGGHTLDAEAYRAAIVALRQAVGDKLIIQVTSEAVGIYNAEQQMAMVRDLKPEAVSLAIKEIVPDEAAEPEAARFLAWLTQERIFPQYILYSAEEVRRFDDLVRRGVVPGERLFVLFVLGRYTKNQESLPADLLPFLEANTTGHPWSLCAFGRREAACAAAAAASAAMPGSVSRTICCSATAVPRRTMPPRFPARQRWPAPWVARSPMPTRPGL